MSGQKLIKNVKNVQFLRGFEILELAVKQCYQTGQSSKDKNWWKMPKFEKFKCDILCNFQTMWCTLHNQMYVCCQGRGRQPWKKNRAESETRTMSNEMLVVWNVWQISWQGMIVFVPKKSGITFDMCPVFKKAIACLDPLTVKLKHSWSRKVRIMVLVSR